MNAVPETPTARLSPVITAPSSQRLDSPEAATVAKARLVNARRTADSISGARRPNRPTSRPPAMVAHQGRRRAVDLCNIGDFNLAVAHIEVEGHRHAAHQVVADPKQGHERQYRQRVAPETSAVCQRAAPCRWCAASRPDR